MCFQPPLMPIICVFVGRHCRPVEKQKNGNCENEEESKTAHYENGLFIVAHHLKLAPMASRSYESTHLSSAPLKFHFLFVVLDLILQ